jgi:tetratricopeptide (TPR) repeat protein
MDCDQVMAQAEAVYRLRAALMVDADVAEAVRWACYRNPVFCVALFACVVRRRFGDSGSPAISRLVQRVGTRRSDAPLGFPEHDAEKLMLLALDEVGVGLSASLAAVDVKYPEIAIAVVSEVVADWRPSSDEVSGLFGEVDETVRVARRLEPDAAKAAAWWFELAADSSTFPVVMAPEDRTQGGGRRDLSGMLIMPGEELLVDAAGAYSQVLEQDPGAVWALAGRVHVRRRLGREEEALGDYGRVLELDPYAAWALCRRARIYGEAGRWEEALGDYSRGVGLRPGEPWAIGGRARAHLEFGHHKDAVADCSRTLEVSTEAVWVVWALCCRGEAYRMLKRYDDALADFTRAIELEPGSAYAVDRRGQT